MGSNNKGNTARRWRASKTYTLRPSFLEAFLSLGNGLVQAWRQLRSFGTSNRERKKDKQLAAAKRGLDVAWQELRKSIGRGDVVPSLGELYLKCTAFGDTLD